MCSFNISDHFLIIYLPCIPIFSCTTHEHHGCSGSYSSVCTVVQTPIDTTSALSSPLAALAQVSQQFDPRDTASLGLQGWDLQQLALYLLVSTLMCFKVVEGKVIGKITNVYKKFTKCFLFVESKKKHAEVICSVNLCSRSCLIRSWKDQWIILNYPKFRIKQVYCFFLNTYSRKMFNNVYKSRIVNIVSANEDTVNPIH